MLKRHLNNLNVSNKIRSTPYTLFGLKIPTFGTTSIQCWGVVISSVACFQYTMINWSFEEHPIINILAIIFMIISMFSLYQTWSNNAGTTPDKGWVSFL